MDMLTERNETFKLECLQIRGFTSNAEASAAAKASQTPSGFLDGNEVRWT